MLALYLGGGFLKCEGYTQPNRVTQTSSQGCLLQDQLPGLLGHDMKDAPSSCHFIGVLYSFFSVVCLQVHVYAHVCAPTMGLPEVTLR